MPYNEKAVLSMPTPGVIRAKRNETRCNHVVMTVCHQLATVGKKKLGLEDSTGYICERVTAYNLRNGLFLFRTLIKNASRYESNESLDLIGWNDFANASLNASLLH